jgi:hypothetical protein
MRRAVEKLERYCPLDRSVVVCHDEAVLHYGDACRERDGYLIRIDYSLDARAAVETLAHEWAHCRAWHRSRTDHGPQWGVEYARAYRVLVDNWQPKGTR